MTSLLTTAPRVQPIPTDSDGLIVPALIPVAAYLCCEQYDDHARARVLERLADGVSPRVCCLTGALDWGDLAEVERLLAPRRPDRGADPELAAWLADPVRTPGVPLPVDGAIGRPEPFRLDWTAEAIEAADRLLCPYPPDAE